jgi:hypothetical protein
MSMIEAFGLECATARKIIEAVEAGSPPKGFEAAAQPIKSTEWLPFTAAPYGVTIVAKRLSSDVRVTVGQLTRLNPEVENRSSYAKMYGDKWAIWHDIPHEIGRSHSKECDNNSTIGFQDGVYKIFNPENM